jgi:hypothetical protein
MPTLQSIVRDVRPWFLRQHHGAHHAVNLHLRLLRQHAHRQRHLEAPRKREHLVFFNCCPAWIAAHEEIRQVFPVMREDGDFFCISLYMLGLDSCYGVLRPALTWSPEGGGVHSRKMDPVVVHWIYPQTRLSSFCFPVTRRYLFFWFVTSPSRRRGGNRIREVAAQARPIGYLLLPLLIFPFPCFELLL